MKKISCILIVLFGTCSASAQQHFEDLNIPAMEQQAQEAKFRSVLSGATDNYDLKYHRCEWDVDPAILYIKGAITSYFKPTVSGFNQIEFDLSYSLTVDSVKYHHSNLSFSQLPSDILQINLPSIIPINVLDSITVYYKGILSHPSHTSFLKSFHNGIPIVFTLSEPYGAKDWWPCKQTLNDKIDSVEVLVTTPQVNRVASNGLLLSEIPSGNNKIYHWKTTYPIAAYLVAIAVTNYANYSDFVPLQGGDSLEVLNYVYPEILAAAQSTTHNIIKIIQF